MTGTRLGPVCQEFCPQRPWSLSSATISGRSTRNILFPDCVAWGSSILTLTLTDSLNSSESWELGSIHDGNRLGVWHIFITSIVAHFPGKCTKKKEFSSRNYWEVIMDLFILSSYNVPANCYGLWRLVRYQIILHYFTMKILILLSTYELWTLVIVNMWTVSVCMGDFWLVIVMMCLQWTSGVFDA